MILIIGKGCLGTALSNALPDCAVIGRPEFDLTSQADCDAIVKQYPLPDVVINTVGVIADNLWASMLVNFVAPSYITMKYVQTLDKGHIINISSASAWWPSHPGLSLTRFTYNISKESFSKFSQHINRVYVNDNRDLVITNVEPGAFQSSMSNYSGMEIDKIVNIVKFAIEQKVQQVSLIKNNVSIQTN